ncbi:MAG: hypothetical protein RUMPE_00995 [Eubacteriales bacterium SKADARSKE-1]|nr:hypothetical protein [Eubacteriales bacterium SKADARSKE-1]
MKKFLASVLALTMIFSLIGGISSFAEESSRPFEEYIKISNKMLIAVKGKISPICFDKLRQKLDYISFLTTFDFTNMNIKQKENIQENICQVEHEFWNACKGDIKKLPQDSQSVLTKINDLMNEMYECPHEMLVS